MLGFAAYLNGDTIWELKFRERVSTESFFLYQCAKDKPENFRVKRIFASAVRMSCKAANEAEYLRTISDGSLILHRGRASTRTKAQKSEIQTSRFHSIPHGINQAMSKCRLPKVTRIPMQLMSTWYPFTMTTRILSSNGKEWNPTQEYWFHVYVAAILLTYYRSWAEFFHQLASRDGQLDFAWQDISQGLGENNNSSCSIVLQNCHHLTCSWDLGDLRCSSQRLARDLPAPRSSGVSTPISMYEVRSINDMR